MTILLPIHSVWSCTPGRWFGTRAIHASNSCASAVLRPKSGWAYTRFSSTETLQMRLYISAHGSLRCEDMGTVVDTS
jgi:hypothetical protein